MRRNRRNISLILAAVVMMGSLGCQSGSREFNWKTFRFERVGPRNHPRIVAQEEEFPEQIPACGLPTPKLTASRLPSG